ncbi:MAG: hypothetical protein ACYDHW_10900 [Syntrophorhabdaceae bacterium]
MSKAPAFQFYVADFIKDTRVLSLAGRGAWTDLLCLMWFSTERGKLSYPIEGYARLFGASIEETKRVIEELIMFQICDSVTECNGNVTLINRRMARDANQQQKTNDRVKRFRNAKEKRDCNAKLTPLSSSSSSSSSLKKEKKKENIPPRTKYLDSVFLSDEEYRKCQEVMGQKSLDIGIEKLDYSITVKSGKYKDHYKTLLNWFRRGYCNEGGDIGSRDASHYLD